MGKLSYTTAQIDSALEKVIDRNYAIASNPSDTPDNVTIASGEVGAYKQVPVTLSAIAMNKFSPSGNTLIYTGDNACLFAFNGTATVASSATATTVNFRLAVNGVTVAGTTSTVKLDTTSERSTINASSGIVLNKNDVLTIHAKADKACTISTYNIQLQLVEV